jgi:hypothetical protein
MGRASLELIDEMMIIAEEGQPITGRGIGYKLFIDKLIASMATREMARVYRLLKEARERDLIPWDWIVDETRALERVSTWDTPEQYVKCVARSYRRDFWNLQPNRCEVWSEKGTVRGVLQPVLDQYGVGFRAMHGFSGATTVHDIADDDDGRPLVALYVGDYDPSGLYMSEHDLPNRLERYNGHHVLLRRIALCPQHLPGLPSFPVASKKKDPRYKWFKRNYGTKCWELDALDTNTLREIVQRAIEDEIFEREAWDRCAGVERAERESLRTVLDNWEALRS